MEYLYWIIGILLIILTIYYFIFIFPYYLWKRIWRRNYLYLKCKLTRDKLKKTKYYPELEELNHWLLERKYSAIP